MMSNKIMDLERKTKWFAVRALQKYLNWLEFLFTTLLNEYIQNQSIGGRLLPIPFVESTNTVTIHKEK